MYFFNDDETATKQVVQLHDSLVETAISILNHDPWGPHEIALMMSALLILVTRLSLLAGQPLNSVVVALEDMHTALSKENGAFPGTKLPTELN